MDASQRPTRAFFRFASLVFLATPTACASPDVSEPFPTPFEVIAHRGASAYAPENTLPAFEKAWELGAVDVELDVQLSRDDVVVLYHDSSLREKTGEAGKVRDHEAARLLEMDIGSWFDRTHPEVEERFAGTRLCTLAALFERFGDRFHYHVELKSDDESLPALALEQVRAYRLEGHVRFTSFLFSQVKRAREIAPEIPVGYLVRDASRLAEQARATPETPTLTLQKMQIDRAREAGFDQVAFAAEDLSPELVGYALRRGLEIRAWRIKNDDLMRRAIEMGATGMTTNWPDRVVRELLLDKRTRPAR